MTICLAEEQLHEAAVGMGQAAFACAPRRLTAILGSCVAVALYVPRLRLGVLSHVVLPQSNGATAYPAKFADTAVPHMIAMLRERGVKPSGLIAKIAGGARMFGNRGKFMDVGDCNAQAAVRALEAANVPVAAADIGGSFGRRIHFDLATGGLHVQFPGRPSRTI